MGVVEKLQQLIEAAKKQATVAVDTAAFNHPLAQDTDWYPMAGGGANFQTHRLDASNPDRLVFKCTPGAYWFAGIFCFVGVLGLVIPLAIFFTQGMQEWSLLLFAFFFGGIFFAAGSLMMYFMTIPRVFDTFYGVYYKARKKPQDQMRSHHNNLSKQQSVKRKTARLSEIKAVQVIPERVSSKNSSYYSYEINLVLDDASRINVIDHGKHEAVINDAQMLATQLGVPLWDAS